MVGRFGVRGHAESRAMFVEHAIASPLPAPAHAPQRQHPCGTPKGTGMVILPFPPPNFSSQPVHDRLLAHRAKCYGTTSRCRARPKLHKRGQG